MLSMFGRTGASTKRGPRKPENAGHFCPFGSLWRVATFKKSHGAARLFLAYIKVPS